MTPDDVLSRCTDDLPPGAYLTSAIVIVEYHVPLADTADERGPFLAFRRDTNAGAWTHLGMIEIAADDIRDEVCERNGDDGP